jgi:hypothetical protein
MTEPPPRKPRSSQQAFALFAYGFRPFFWAAGVFATLGLIAWLWVCTIGALPRDLEGLRTEVELERVITTGEEPSTFAAQTPHSKAAVG